MNNIKSLKEIRDKEIRRKRIGGIVIIALLLLSTLGFAISMINFGSNPSVETKTEQGFSTNGQYWIYTAGSQKYYFTHHPDELNYSFSLNKSLADFAGKVIYLSSDIPGGIQEVYNSLGIYTGKINEACYGPCDKDLPEKNEEDCLLGENVVILRQSSNSRIYEENSCTFIEGDMKTVDSFLFKILGIK